MSNKVVISSGHGKLVQGAVGIINEVAEARKVVDRVAVELKQCGVGVLTFHDDVSKTQSENLNRIVTYHNKQQRQLDISIHFNAYQPTPKPMGVEVLYVSQEPLAARLSRAIAAAADLTDRGAKFRSDLAFLNGTDKPAVLIEVCFVDSEYDVGQYTWKFNDICRAIATTLVGDTIEEPVETDVLFQASGRCSTFGGPDDEGVASGEGLALVQTVDQAEHLFLPSQPYGTTGLARRLNPYIHYIACRWDYDVTPKPELLQSEALVRSKRSGLALRAFPADWGPHEDTGRVADLSPGLMQDLGLTTDDEVEVVFPYWSVDE